MSQVDARQKPTLLVCNTQKISKPKNVSVIANIVIYKVTCMSIFDDSKRFEALARYSLANEQKNDRRSRK